MASWSCLSPSGASVDGMYTSSVPSLAAAARNASRAFGAAALPAPLAPRALPAPLLLVGPPPGLAQPTSKATRSKITVACVYRMGPSLSAEWRRALQGTRARQKEGVLIIIPLADSEVKHSRR